MILCSTELWISKCPYGTLDSLQKEQTRKIANVDFKMQSIFFLNFYNPNYKGIVAVVSTLLPSQLEN